MRRMRPSFSNGPIDPIEAEATACAVRDGLEQRVNRRLILVLFWDLRQEIRPCGQRPFNLNPLRRYYIDGVWWVWIGALA